LGRLELGLTRLGLVWARLGLGLGYLSQLGSVDLGGLGLTLAKVGLGLTKVDSTSDRS
jgi:hypothetical protein